MTVGTRIQLRRDTAANWTSANPVLLAGEYGYETDTGKSKVGNGTSVWNSLGYATAGAALDKVSIPQPLGTAGPGVSDLGATADHAHAMPLLSAFSDIDMTGAADGQVLTYDGAAGKLLPKAAALGVGSLPLWQAISAGEITLPRGHSDDSSSYGSNPASGEMRLTYWRALQSGARNSLRFQTGGSAAATSTLARVGIYSVDQANMNLTALLASCTNKTTFAGTYAQQTCALTAPVTFTAGQIYAVGILQVATTPSSLLGAWFNGTFMGAGPKLARKLTGLSDLPAGPVTTGFGDTQFPVYCEIV